ncbi:MAG: phosphate acyltransferase PlsX [Hyphomicrobiales bacterium]|nr:phosphate acyltransferase [Rhodobiaceae bacterium]OUT82651.1 MAG: phosphate acyltransferase [Rhizobiales bacterium TMED28]RZO31761.1 MAG: phosphate acyltransferase PlsX [Hyphomicrobiales bacterium]|tara:strand:+ start:475 stop:1509 length:1035 start_codon:yes stop_codon:yes gene_type:complete
MSNQVNIAVDCMGGDDDAAFVLPGLLLTLKKYPNIKFQLFGDEKTIKSRISQYRAVENASDIIHCDTYVKMDEKPSNAIKNGRGKSSIWIAIEHLKRGDADFMVSAGNTGALMAMSTLILKTISKIQRPAIAAIWPTINGETIVLDIGATIGFNKKQLIDFSILGASMAQIILDVERPTLSLLNIGEEEIKGLDEIKASHEILKSTERFFKYKGFIEGNQIGRGFSDVVVTDGFTGNVALKTAEGTASQISKYFKDSIDRSIMAKVGYLFAASAFRSLREKMNPSRLNGGVFLGLNGIVIKSHGKTDPIGFSSAVELGIDMHRAALLDKIKSNIELTEKDVNID